MKKHLLSEVFSNDFSKGSSNIGLVQLVSRKALLGMALLGLSCSSHAATVYWTAQANSSLWDENTGPVGGPFVTNWSTGGLPSSSDVVIFGAANMVNNQHTVNLNGNRSVRRLGLSAGLSGQAFTIGNVVGTHKLTVSRDTVAFPQTSLTSSGADHVINCDLGLNDSSSQNLCVFSVSSNSLTVNGVVSGSDGILVDGGGTLILSGANTYSGGTTISTVTLRATNSSGSASGSGALYVGSSGRLEGNGTISGAVTTDPNGTISPGAGSSSIQTLNFGSNVTLSGAYTCELSGSASADKLAVTGVLDVSAATLNVSELGTLTGETYTIATCSNTPAPFAAVTGLSNYVVQYNAGSITLVRSPYYVDATASAGGDGLSWGTAFNTLQDALALAGDGDEVWVANGVYYPDEGGSQTNNNRSATFRLNGGVRILGGFAGGESSSSLRDPAVNKTVLSGDIDKNDPTNSYGVVESADDINGSNSYKVVYVDYSASTAFLPTGLDGVVITGGKADGSTAGRFTSRGGALLVETSGSGNKPTFTNCQFYGNYAYQGGGVCVGTWAYADFENCDIRANRSADIGGGMFFWRSSVNLTQCNISGNIAGRDGGGIYDYMHGSGHVTSYTNCTISGNISSVNGGGLATNLPANNTLRNILIWNNQDQSGQASTNNTAMNLSNCLFEDVNLTAIGTDNLNGTLSASDPKFVSEINLATMSSPTLGGDRRLMKNSGAADGGNNAFISLTEDLYGDPRVENSTVDIGAYELDVTAPVFTLLGDGIQTLEVDDSTSYAEPGFTVVDDRDGDIAASTTVITQVNMGVAGFGSVTYIGNDAAGNVFSSGRTVILTDTTKPTITAPADLNNVEITSPSGMAVSLGSPTLADNASADPTPSNNAPALFQLGVTNVTWTTQDVSGNTSDPDVQMVTVVDTTDPVITTSQPLADINVEDTGAPATVSLTAPSATDNGDASPNVTNNAPSTFPLGTTVVRWTVTDASGNSTTADQNVIVADTIAPTITAPANITGLEGNTSITDPSNSFNKIGGYTGVSLGNPTNVSDTVDTSVSVTNDAPTVFPLGTTTVTWRAEDDAGNFTEVTQTVQVVDTSAPVLTLTGEEILQFEEGTNFNVPSVSVVEVCDSDMQVSAVPFLNAGSVAGTYEVTYSATDESGNVATPVYRTVIVGEPSSSVYCVDDISDFSVTTDRGLAGLSVGDTVTWNSPSGAVTDLVYGWNAHTNLIDALAKVPVGGTVQIGEGIFAAGQRVDIGKTVTLSGFGSEVSKLSGAGSNKVMELLWSPSAYDVTLENLALINGGGSGSGRALSSNAAGEVRINNVRFAGHDGGTSTILNLYGDVVLTNCEVSGCSTSSTFIEVNSDSNPTVFPKFINCTIAGNQGDKFRRNDTNTVVHFDNCVIWDNDFSEPITLDTSNQYRHCLLEGVSSADYTASNAANIGNLDGAVSTNNPLFVKVDAVSALPSTSGDYRIASNSSLVDQGDNVFNAMTVDQLGASRVIGAAIDIGAHEVADSSVQGGSESFVYTDATGLGTFELNDLASDFTGSPTEFSEVSNSNPDLISVSVVGSKVNVTLTQVGFATLRFSASNGSSIGVHTIHFGVVPPVIYVDQSASGAGTGLSWADALPSLQDALLGSRLGVNQEIWVAQGEYFPDLGKAVQDDDQLASFVLEDTHQVYGGFSGSETARSQRQPKTNLTILSGDIDGNDVDANNDGVLESYTGIQGANANRILHCKGVSAATVLDGLIFTGGNAIAFRNDQGPAIWADSSSLLVTQCVFQGNSSSDEASAVFLDNGGSASFSHCEFRFNECSDYSGALYFFKSAGYVAHCVFENNIGSYGGAMYIDDSNVDIDYCEFRANFAEDGAAILFEDTVLSTVSNCLFSGNWTDGRGAIFELDNDVNLTLRSCTFAGNYSSSASGELFYVDTQSSLTFENCVVWDNDINGGLSTANTFENNGTVSISYSLLEGFTAAGLNAFGAGGTGNLSGTASSDRPRFLDSPAANTAPFTTGDYRVTDGRSPILDAGVVNAHTPNYDLDGKPRVIRAAIDLGCYERSPSAFDSWIATYYPKETDINVVSQTGDPSGNGMPNLLAFITNSDPTVTTPQNDVVGMAVGATELVFEFPRRDDSTYVNSVIELSTNLVDFDSAVHGENGIIIEVEDDGFGTSSDGVGIDKVKVRIPKDGRPALFGRLANE